MNAWPLVVWSLAGVSLAAVAFAPPAQTTPGAPVPAPATVIRFTDVTKAAGIDFHHTNGRSGHYFYIEQLGGGAAFFDYDADGWLDLFLAQGAPLPGATDPPPAGNVLYRNNRNGTFTDVTAAAGLRSTRFTLGAATADYDEDGDVDLFVTTLVGNQLYRNTGRGRFVDATATARLAGEPLSTGASFLDYDGDGLLDLFVARYAPYAISMDRGCADYGSHLLLPETPDPATGVQRKVMCSPNDLRGASNRLYRNLGDGTFRDVTDATGIGKAIAHGFGAAVADYDDDGRLDIFVASDMLPNLLFMNGPDGTFREDALVAGVALGPEGRAYAGMGVDAGDYDNDGRIDLFITNFEKEQSSLYRNVGKGLFEDESARSGIAAMSQPFLKWACRFLDLDYDGHQDLFVVNGHVNTRAVSYPVAMEHLQRGRGHAQRAQIYRNGGRGRFSEVSTAAGEYFLEKYVGRGAAFGDYDNDGDVDVLVTNNNQPAILLRNDTPRAGRWVQLALEGSGRNRHAIGARVRVTSGGITQTQVVKSGASYLADHDRRLVFGLPGADTPTAEIRWPCGAGQRVTIEPGRTMVVREEACLHRRRPARTAAR